jgi:transcriptional regulator with GAF, ATPase, and Fis domain
LNWRIQNNIPGQIGDMPLSLQVRCSACFRKTIERIGGGNVIKVDVRICGT